MYSMRVKSVMERKKRLVAPPETTVAKAAKLMAKKNVGAVMVVEGKRLVGIFTERDAVFRVIAAGLDPATTTIGEVMTPDPITVEPERDLRARPAGSCTTTASATCPWSRTASRSASSPRASALDPEMEEFTAETQRRLSLR